MAEYIDIDDQVVVTDTRGRELETTVRHIFEMNKGVYTAADVRPVVRARWNTVKYPIYECSNCGAVYQEVGYGFNYCPNCGADMREANDEKA